MVYLGAKALHILAMVIWMSGMIFVPIAIRSYGPGSPPADACRRLSRIFASLCTPAMIAVWILGLYIASAGGWLSGGWLLTKLGLVVVLSGLHGAIAGQLRRAASEGGRAPLLGIMYLPVLVLLAAILFLAVLRP